MNGFGSVAQPSFIIETSITLLIDHYTNQPWEKKNYKGFLIKPQLYVMKMLIFFDCYFLFMKYPKVTS